MESDITGIEAKQLQRQLDTLQRRQDVAIKALILIRDTNAGTQAMTWYSELAARALAEIKAMEGA